MLAGGIDLVVAHLGAAAPFRPTPPVAVLLECRAAEDPVAELAAGLQDAVAGEVLVAVDASDRRRLWAIREAHAEAIAGLGIPHKLDVTVPDAGLPGFLSRVGGAVGRASPGARTIVFGHLGVGDYHVNVVGPPPDDETADAAVLRLVAELGGDVAGEHGAGIAKARWLSLTRSAAELAAIAARKARYDPTGRLNPGVIPAARVAPLPSSR
jgi:FAD/FMN-containing dehydrogenase